MRPSREVELHRNPSDSFGNGRFWSAVCILVVMALVIVPAMALAANDQAPSSDAAARDDQALAQVDEFLGDHPGDSEALLLKGVLLTRMGRINDAKGVFLTLIQEHPELPEPYNNLATLYGATGDYEQAIEVLKLALRTHPSYEVVYENLTRVYGRLAGQAYDRALGVEPENPAEPVSLDLLEVIGERLETTPSRVAADRAAERFGKSPVEPAAAPSAQVATTTTETASPSTGRAAVAGPPSEPAPRVGLAADAVRAWAGAWSSQDVNGYLGFYSTRFVAPDGLSRDAWARQRRERISKPGFIAVSVSDEVVEQTGERTVRVRFRQSYRSDNYRDVVVKVLDLVWEGDGWRILDERVDRGAA